MEKAYSRIKWENYPSIATPLNETNLNKMDMSLDEVDNRVLGLDTAKLDKAVANSMVKDITFDEATGIFTITSLDGTTKAFDTKLEKVATNFSYDYETQKLKLTLLDGTEQEIDMSTLISQYEFADTSTIGFTVGNEGKITAIVKDGSITEDKLQPNFLADIKVEVAKGKSYSDSAYENATTSSNASKEAKQYRDEAEQFRNEAEALSGVTIATTEKAGIVKPDGTTIRVDEDGTIHADAGTVDYTELENKPSINGTELDGNKTLDELGIASKEKVETLETELAKTTYKVDTVIANVDLGIKETASGEEIHLTDSAEGKAVEFALFGKARQNTTSGKNKMVLDQSLNTDSQYFTYSSNTQESIIATVNAKAHFIATFKATLEKGKTYTITFNNSRQLSVNLYSDKIWGNSVQSFSFASKGKTFTFEGENGEYIIGLYADSSVANGEVVSLSNMQLEENTVSTEYEKYSGGMASPNPQFPQSIEVSGASYNLLENTATSQTINGVEFVVNDDKSVTVNGTASANAIFVLNSGMTFEAEENYEYTNGAFSGGNSVFASQILRFDGATQDGSYSDIGSGASFKGVEGKTYTARIVVYSGVTINNATLYPMIRKASVKNDRYMPYGKGSVEVKSVGKNLFDGILEKGMYENNNFSLTNTASEVYKSLKVFLEAGTYVFSFSKAVMIVRSILDEKYVTKNIENVVTYSVTLSQGGFIGLSFRDNTSSSTIWDENTTIQIEKGSIATPFQKYQESKAIINGEFAGIKVSSGGNYTDQNGQQWICDEVVKYADGSGKHIQRIGKTVFDGSSDEAWAVSEAVSGRYTTKLSNAKSSAISICSHAVAIPSNTNITDVGICAINSSKVYYINTNILTLQEFKTMLTSSPITLYYELAEPIETPLTAEELAEISTFYPATNISNDFDCGMKITYNCDSKNYIDNKIALLTTAMVNNI